MKKIMTSQVLKRFDSFAKALNAKDKIAVLTDYDADGLSAGALIIKAVEKLTGKKPEIVKIALRQKEPVDENFVQKLQKAKITKFISSDISLETKGRKEFVEKISEFAECLVIDHHKIYGKFKSKNILLVKPQFFSRIEPSKYPASKMVFDLFSRVCILKENAWIAAVGIYGDFSEKNWVKFFNQAAKSAGISRKRIIDLSYILVSVKSFNHSLLKECLLELVNGKPKTVLKNFEKFVKRFNKELDLQEKKFNKNAECIPELEFCFYSLNSKADIASALINRISSKRKHCTVIIVQKNFEGIIGLHARRQDCKIAMNELLEKSVKGLKNASAGGHIPAAGGRIMEKDLKKFKKKVLKILKTKYN